MAKARKKAAEPAPPPLPQVGDRVTLKSSSVGSVFLVTQVSEDTVNLLLPGTNLERFRVPISDLNFVGQAPRPRPNPNPPTTPKTSANTSPPPSAAPWTTSRASSPS